MSAIAYLDRSKTIVEEALERHFSTKAVAPNLREAMLYSLRAGGKRLRPALAFASCEAVGGKPEVVIPAACALEMIHTYSLIHDDLPAMDDDDFRRGKPTSHKVFGEALAILAGDGLLTETFSCLSDPAWEIPAEARLRIVRAIADAAGPEGMVAGQVLDLEYEGKKFDESVLEVIHRNKTGRVLTASVQVGGMAGGADEKSLEALTRYGDAIGLAFQIADDLLDLTATTEEMGKPAKSDLKKGKATYPSLVGIEASRKRAKFLLDQALAAIDPFGPQGENLALLARFIVERRK